MCHTSTYPPSWNSYGLSLFGGLGGGDFDAKLADALRGVELLDSDNDGLTNYEELVLGTWPGDEASAYTAAQVADGPKNPAYRVGEYDPRFAFKRVSLTYCGESPSYETMKAFEALDGDDAAQMTEIHARLDDCLQSEYWRREALPGLGDKRIRPVFAVGWESPVNIKLADYTWDYNLFVYALTDDRDARDLLLADYHVEERFDRTLSPVEGEVDQRGNRGGQPLEPERRAGMITTQWFLVINTMFSALPRTTAAHAYRSYLGADISLNEGLLPVAGEPLDVDNKGVREAECASCHSTLDPLSYAFAYYEGISGGRTGTYREQRPSRQIPGWSDPKSVIYDTEVSSVVEWASVAAESDAFKRNLAQMFFEHALQRPPGPAEAEVFAALWRSLPEDGYSVNRLLHRLVELDAFGAP